ncbi:ABC transporter ATP-binding protein [Kitasatospora sp. NPDC056446]|uniref:ABC transporter ATP-binding protein n=1 Tax=Kitasatospora sp. NPDC056446 TaxID=3345819 RepID=UPI0036AF9746
MAVIEVEDLSRTFRSRRGREVTALDRVGFHVERGEVLGLLGPNGAGKTTLSRILTTLLLPTSGTARVAGFDVVRRPREVRRRIGLVLGGDRGLYGRLTARQNLRYWAALQGLDARTSRRRGEEVLALLGLGGRADDRVETFSRGMVQRVHLARALLGEPDVLVMDEPTNGMDPHAGAGFRELVRTLRSGGTTVILTTHDMQEAQALCSRVALIDHGRILRIGSATELLAGIRAPRTLTARGVPPETAARIAGLPGTAETDAAGNLTARPADEDSLAQALLLLAQARADSIAVAAPSLTEVYRTIIEDREFAL